MSDLKDFMRDLGYFSVGAAAVIVEAGGKVVKSLVKKGEKTLRDNQDTVDELKRKAKAAGERIKEAVDKATSAPEEAEPEVDAPVVPDAIYHTDEPVPEEPAPVDVPTVDIPTVETPEPPEEPTVADIPEKPEETING